MTLQESGTKTSKLYYLIEFSLGIDMEAIKVKRNPPQNIIHPIPPHNGFGSEEDSMLNVKFLDPNGKIHEYVSDKFKRDKHILRFNAKLISSVPSAEERTFIISFFLRDEAVQVYETAQRNSGRQSCKFIERQRCKNPYTKKYYTEKDFITGNVVYINKFIFKLLESDEYTKKYMIDNPEVFKDSNITHVVGRLRVPANQNESFEDYLVKMLKVIDPQGKNYASKQEIENGFKSLGVYLTAQEIITLTDRLRMNNNNEFSMEDLYNLVASN